MQFLRTFICCLAVIFSLTCRPAAAEIIVTGQGNGSASSWLGGAHAGYNWQQGTLLYGVETDFQATHLNSAVPGILQFNPDTGARRTDFAGAAATIDWYGTLRGRMGMTFGSLLLYLTGGVAYGNVDLNSNFSAFGMTTSALTSTPRIGGVVGAGGEYLIKPNLMLTFQYQFVDLGRVNAASGFAGILNPDCCVAMSQSATVRAQFQAAMIGFSWRFAPDGSASPWAGGYAGGHAGGAWGNNASASYDGLDTRR